MQKPQAGDTVRVHYTGTLEDGTQFDSSRGADPLEFAMGQGQLIAGFEMAVAGLAPGESVTVTLAPRSCAMRRTHTRSRWPASAPSITR